MKYYRQAGDSVVVQHLNEDLKWVDVIFCRNAHWAKKVAEALNRPAADMSLVVVTDEDDQTGAVA